LWKGISDTLALMSATLQAFIAIFLIGAALRSFALLGKFHAERLATLVFSISLPATILVSLDRMTFAATAWKVPLAACLVTLLMLLCSWRLSRLLELPRATQGGLMLGTAAPGIARSAVPGRFMVEVIERQARKNRGGSGLRARAGRAHRR
jgi:malate permease and related proteins